MRKLDSSQTLALAQKFQEAADEIRQSKQLLVNRLKAVGSGWQGEARNKFDQSFEETTARYDQFEKDLLETSQELRDAASKEMTGFCFHGSKNTACVSKMCKFVN